MVASAFAQSYWLDFVFPFCDAAIQRGKQHIGVQKRFVQLETNLKNNRQNQEQLTRQIQQLAEELDCF